MLDLSDYQSKSLERLISFIDLLNIVELQDKIITLRNEGFAMGFVHEQQLSNFLPLGDLPLEIQFLCSVEAIAIRQISCLKTLRSRLVDEQILNYLQQNFLLKSWSYNSSVAA